MSRLARTLILGVALAAMNLAGTTAIAQAHTSDDPASKRHRVLGQLELLTAEDAVASQEQPTIADDARRPPTEAQVGESWHPRANVPMRPVEPSGHPGWLVLGLGVLAAALALSAGLAVRAAKRAGRRVRAGQAA